ncbi:MAG: IS1182 family transposase [Bacteroidota bacterium]|nr:IS1182 family transposase [Flavisolibacter sp.]MDQ3844503.1 IS1182 family transposase [Bacteroidota bacterium]
MRYITGTNRSQAVLFPQSLEEIIEQDNEVRLIDLFVESLDLSTFQFHLKGSFEGRPAYHPKDLLKLYVYGYLNSVRSSRALEKECKRNVEVMWLLHQLVPDHNTISNFRRDNEKAIRKVFRHTVSIAKNFELIGGKLLAGDSTKLRAQNSKKNNFNEEKITQHLQYIERRVNEYNSVLEQADSEDNKNAIQAQIEKQNDRKQKYHQLSEQLQQSGEPQISTSDPDSRQLMIRNRVTEVAYSVQTTVDEKNKITLDYKVTNENDSKALGGMLRRAKVILGHTDFTALYDKGYHTGSELKKGVEMGVKLMVAVPGVASFAPDQHYNVEHFTYDAVADTYTCPQAEVLHTNGNWYVKSDHGYVVKHYKTAACLTCPVFALCTRNKKGRLIERSEYQGYVEQNKRNIENDPATYKKRQAIIEHTYGTIKRQWGFSYVCTKRGLKRASADVGLMVTAYNLRRLMNSITKNALKAYLRKLASLCFAKTASVKSFSALLLLPGFTHAFFLPLKRAAA